MKININIVSLFILFLLCTKAQSQNKDFSNIQQNIQQIKGMLKGEKGQKITLYGYKNFDTYTLSSAIVDSLGNFTINYKGYEGMGFLKSSISNKATSVLFLNQDLVKLKGVSLLEKDSLEVLDNIQNKIFKQYAIEHKQRSNVYAAWSYLDKLYKNTTILKTQNSTKINIANEIIRLKAEDSVFLKNIDTKFYMSWYLPLRKLIDEMPASATRYTERIPKNIAAFRHINFNDKRFYHSGILTNLLETHYWLIENSGRSLDSVFVEMNKSTDYLIENLKENDELLNKVSGHLFHFLEKRSLFNSSEYLAIKMLTENSCVLDEKLANQLENYRAMKVGSIAPKIEFDTGIQMHYGKVLSKNSTALPTDKYKATLVVFGASWCPKCVQEIPKILLYYPKWKKKGIQVVFISLDTNKVDFINFAHNFPWFSYCDLKKWKGKLVNQYYVNATPSMYLLDANRKILVRPVSVEHVDTWINYKL